MPGERREAGSKGTVHAPPPHPARGNRQSASPVTPPLGIGNREWGIVGMGNGEADSLLLMKSGRGGRGRIALSIPHSRLPIPKGGVVGGSRFPIPVCRFPSERRWGGEGWRWNGMAGRPPPATLSSPLETTGELPSCPNPPRSSAA